MVIKEGWLFISHSSEDGSIAGELAANLQQLGISCWIAPRDIPPGADWAESIMQGIEKADAFLILATGSSLSSSQVRRETEKASNLDLPVITALFQTGKPPGWLLYYTSSDNLIHLSEESVPQAALRIMSMLQKPSARGVSHGGELIPRRRDHGRNTAEFRSFYATAVHIGHNIPLYLRNLTMTTALKIAKSFGGQEARTALPGSVYLFDGLTEGNTAENVSSCTMALGRMLQESLGPEWGVGLTAGKAAFDYPSELLREAEGTVMNAVELSEKARGKILASEEFRRRCSHLLGFSVHQPGIYTPGTNFSGGKPSGTTVRKEELRILTGQLEDQIKAADSPGLGGIPHRITGIKGDHGSGKTILVTSFVSQLPENCRAFMCSPLESDWPHNRIWHTLLEELSGVKQRPPDVTELEKWRENLYLLLKRASENRHLTMVLEDIDRSDTAGLQTFQQLLPRHDFSSPFHFILTYREPPATALKRVLSRFPTVEIELGGLTAEQLGTITGGIGEFSRETLEHILAFSGGNPLFARELLVQTLGNGMLTEINGLWQLQGNPDTLPPAMEEEAFEVLAELTPLQRDILRIGAASGTHFCEKRIEPSFTKDRDRLTTQLTQLVAGGILDSSGGSFGTRYSFTRGYIRQAVLSTIHTGGGVKASS